MHTHDPHSLPLSLPSSLYTQTPYSRLILSLKCCCVFLKFYYMWSGGLFLVWTVGKQKGNILVYLHLPMDSLMVENEWVAVLKSEEKGGRFERSGGRGMISGEEK